LNAEVSIIIPTFNRAHLIGETLDSILKQTFQNWECIIVDDGSRDDIEKFIETYSKKDARFVYLTRPKNLKKGANSCRNYGYSNSNGDYIKWLDSDDILLPKALENQYNLFSNGALDVVVSKLEFTDFETKNRIKVNAIQSDDLIYDYFIGKIAFYVSGPLWKKSFLEKQKVLFDEKISNLDDWDFNLRMLYKSPKIVFDDTLVVQYRIHNDSLTSEILKLNHKELKSELLARDKHLLLTKEFKLTNYSSFLVYSKDRSKFILREVLFHKKKHKMFFLKHVIISQYRCNNFLEIPKTIFAYLLFRLFNVGFKYL
jgi:glycosyltransferase involved in cell wall biosynthesis